MKKLILSIFLFLFLAIFNSTRVFGAILVLDPASKSTPEGQTFNVAINIDTEGEKTTSADSILKYDSTILEVINIVEGDGINEPFFPDMFKNITSTEIYVGAAVNDPTETREGTGTVATITFRGKLAGASDVKFDCTAGKTSDTNISKNDKNATDIVECSRVINGRYTIGSGVGAPSPTSTYPTSTPAPIVLTNTPRPTMPTSGNSETTIGLVGAGILLTAVGIASKIILKL